MKPYGEVYSVTIIGMGPRGLSVFERFAAFARENSCPLQINLIDPSACGPGGCAPRQPQHLLGDTPASQITVFPSAGSVEFGPACVTPSLAEWARAQGYRRFGAAFHKVGEGGLEITDNDCLPRQLLGRYLGWAYGAIAASMPPTVKVQHLRHRAVDMVARHDGGFTVELDSGFTVPSDFVFLTTGQGISNLSDEEAWLRKFAQDHARYNSKLRYVRHAWPLDKLAGISHDAEVGIQGMGLGAHDVLAELTVGRGGRFEAAGRGLRYVASGQEPRLTMFSRSCLPASARGINQKGVAGRHQAQYFTRDAVRSLRAQALRERGSVQLDFERELLPLLIKEMGFAYRCAQDSHAQGAPDPVWYRLGNDESEAIDGLLFPLRGRVFEDGDDFAAYVRAFLETDLEQARRGNVSSPLKAVAEVLRDTRAVLQECLDHGGLLAASHRKFLGVYQPAFRRVGFGPQIERNCQLLALMEAGVLRVADGPGPVVRIDEERSQFALHTRFDAGTTVQHLDAVIVARQEVFSPETEESLLTRNLLKRGTTRPFYNGTFHPGGLDIDVGHHPFGRDGTPSVHLWALGAVTEGALFGSDDLPRPQWQSRQVLEAELCVAAMFNAMEMPRAKAAGRARNVPVQQLDAVEQAT